MDYFDERDFFSRAVDEDDEDAEMNSGIDGSSATVAAPALSWTNATEHSECVKCSTLFIVIGPQATGFIKRNFLQPQLANVIGSISCSDDKTENELSEIWQLETDRSVLFAVCPSDIDVKLTFSWTQQLLTSVCSPDSLVFVLTTVSVADYKSLLSPGDLPNCFIRTLATKNATKTASVVLEQPNLISGLSAQVISYCEVYSISCQVCLCYVNTAATNADVVSILRVAVQSLPLRDSLSTELASYCKKQMVSDTSPCYSSHSVLYT